MAIKYELHPIYRPVKSGCACLHAKYKKTQTKLQNNNIPLNQPSRLMRIVFRKEPQASIASTHLPNARSRTSQLWATCSITFWAQHAHLGLMCSDSSQPGCSIGLFHRDTYTLTHPHPQRQTQTPRNPTQFWKPQQLAACVRCSRRPLIYLTHQPVV